MPTYRAYLINGENRFTTAAFLSVFAIPFIGQEPFEHGQEKGAKPAALPRHVRKEFLLQQAGEELLGQILGFLDRVAPPPDESIKRHPIGAAKRFEGGLCGWRLALRR